MDSTVFIGVGAPLAVRGVAVGMGGRGGGCPDKPLRLGVLNGSWGWQHELPGPEKR